jgi:predicted nucleotidyltransferase
MLINMWHTGERVQMVSPEIAMTIRRYLLALNAQGMPVRCGVLFGSYVKGNVHEWMDIDLLVVSPRFDEPRSRADINMLWRTAAEVDSRIEPLAVGERQLAEDRGSPILEIARREGEVIELEPV